MILIPEIEKVLILTPRAASTSLKNAVLNKYPESVLIYRHMEADGVPHGYDAWEKIGVIRHPLQRLWSLYKYLKKFTGDYCPEYIKKMNKCVEGIDFSDWVVSNKVVFTSPYGENGKYHAKYTINHSLPENIKSQYLYLRPDLGTKIFRFDRLYSLANYIGVDLEQLNASKKKPFPEVNQQADEHIKNIFSWDLDYFRYSE